MPNMTPQQFYQLMNEVLADRSMETFRAALFADPDITDEEALIWERIAQENGTRKALQFLADVRAFQRNAFLD